jgi:hypothetical protein
LSPSSSVTSCTCSSGCSATPCKCGRLGIGLRSS